MKTMTFFPFLLLYQPAKGKLRHVHVAGRILTQQPRLTLLSFHLRAELIKSPVHF